MRFRETKGHWPFMKASIAKEDPDLYEKAGSDRSSETGVDGKEPVIRHGEVAKHEDTVA